MAGRSCVWVGGRSTKGTQEDIFVGSSTLAPHMQASSLFGLHQTIRSNM